MQPAARILFKLFKKGLLTHAPLFSKVHFHFIGTSYAPAGKGIPTIAPIAEEIGVADFVTEYTERKGFYSKHKKPTKCRWINNCWVNR